MNTTKICLTVIILTLLAPIRSGALEIRQEVFWYAIPEVQGISATTFVITGLPRPGRQAMIGCQPPTAHFQLGSAVLVSAEAEILLAGLRKCRIALDTLLAVTGHTCTLGPDQVNQQLSLQRARAVANLLLERGFTVGEVVGQGSRSPLTTDPQQCSLNRRVEIIPVAPHNEIAPASLGH